MIKMTYLEMSCFVLYVVLTFLLIHPYVYNHFKNFVGIYGVKMRRKEFEFHKNVSG